MSINNTSTEQAIKLTTVEVNLCNKIKQEQQGLVQKRAIALLLIDANKTYPEAAEGSGLTIGQVRYLVTGYRKKGIALLETSTETSAQITAKPKTVVKPKVAVKTKVVTEPEAITELGTSTNPEATVVKEDSLNINKKKKAEKKDKKKKDKQKKHDKKSKKDKKDKKDKKKNKK